MKRLFIFLMFIHVYATGAYAQLNSGMNGTRGGEDLFKLQLLVDRDIQEDEVNTYRDEVDRFIVNLKSRHQNTSRARLIEDMFYRGHNKFLRNYTELTKFSDLLSRGRYDCLTATIFYSYCLNALNIDHTIIETPHHIFLMIEDENILLETTDPINGFVKGELSQQLASEYEGMEDSEEVLFRQTIGLQYYNAAVHAFNSQDYLLAVERVVHSSQYYSGPRLIKIGLMLSRAITKSDFSEDVKFEALLKLTRTLDGEVQMAGIN